VEQLAGMMQISKRSLSMKCRALLGDSPAQLFTRFKIQKAVQLLSHTDRPVKEISYELGFENPYHFSRVFRRICGTTPSTLR
jgi:AraC-like DNA-binding protein